MPHGGAGRPRRALRRLRAHAGRLQLVPQPALPQVPVAGGPGLARGARGGAAAGPLLPRRVHPAGGARRDRLPEQGPGLRPAAQGRGGGADHDRRRPEAPRGPDRRHRGAAHLGADARPPPARALHRAGRRHLASTAAAGSPAGRASSCRCGCSRACSGACSSTASPRRTARARSSSSATSPGSREPGAFQAHLAAQRRREWVVYAKAPFAGPQQVLGYLARYTHRVAISNRRLVALDDDGQVSFRWKDYRASGRTKPKVMRLPAGEFMRRFLLHVLPDGFHRIRHYGLLANGHRAAMLARCRELLDVPPAPAEADGGGIRGSAREGGGAGLPVLRRADADRRAPAGPDLAPLSRRASPTAGDERAPSSAPPAPIVPPAVMPATAPHVARAWKRPEIGGRSVAGTARDTVLGGPGRPLARWRGVRARLPCRRPPSSGRAGAPNPHRRLVVRGSDAMGRPARREHHRRRKQRWSAPMPRPNDLRRSLLALEQESTLIAVIELSQLELARRRHRAGPRAPPAEEARAGRGRPAPAPASLAGRGGQGGTRDHPPRGRLRGRPGRLLAGALAARPRRRGPRHPPDEHPRLRASTGGPRRTGSTPGCSSAPSSAGCAASPTTAAWPRCRRSRRRTPGARTASARAWSASGPAS